MMHFVEFNEWGQRRSPRDSQRLASPSTVSFVTEGTYASASYSISPNELWNAIATREAPQIVDVRRRDAFEHRRDLLPGAAGASRQSDWIGADRPGPADRRRLQGRP